MSIEVFKTYDDACEFLMYEMPRRGGTYYFMKSKMVCEENALVLFQYQGRLIGYVIYEDMVSFDKPYLDGNMSYLGYYKFLKGSIRLLKNPITAKQLKKLT